MNKEELEELVHHRVSTIIAYIEESKGKRSFYYLKKHFIGYSEEALREALSIAVKDGRLKYVGDETWTTPSWRPAPKKTRTKRETIKGCRDNFEVIARYLEREPRTKFDMTARFDKRRVSSIDEFLAPYLADGSIVFDGTYYKLGKTAA